MMPWDRVALWFMVVGTAVLWLFIGSIVINMCEYEHNQRGVVHETEPY